MFIDVIPDDEAKVVNADKQEKEIAEIASQTNEIEKLKRQLAALQQATAGATGNTPEQAQTQTETLSGDTTSKYKARRNSVCIQS